MNRLFGFLITLFLLAGCSSERPGASGEAASRPGPVEIPEHLRDTGNLYAYPADMEPNYSIRFEKELVIQDSEEHFIGYVSVFTVDDQGRVYIYGSQSFQVFDADGRYLTTLGGEGEGPGEFSSFSYIIPFAQSGYLYATDHGLRRINVFSLETFEFSHTILFRPEQWEHIEAIAASVQSQSNLHILNDGTFLAGFFEPSSPGTDQADRRVRYYHLTGDGEFREPAEPVFEQITQYLFEGFGIAPPMSTAAPPRLPLDRGSLMDVSDDGTIFSAWNEEFLIEVHDLEGNRLRTIYHPFDQSRVNKEEVVEAYGYGPGVVRIVRNMDMPETWPALAFLKVDDEKRLWVATMRDDNEQYEWWVLDEYGELLARFQWPGSKLRRHIEPKEIRHIRNGYLYTRETTELDEAQIVRYRIVMEEAL